jgi:hypothetical protein
MFAVTPNPSIERTATGKGMSAVYVKREVERWQ